jgi:Flp pilus assembly protein TadG
VGVRVLARAGSESEVSRVRKIATGTLGSEIAEAALVLPIFFMIMLGIYWFGRAFNVYATINHAARQGARLGTAQTCATCGATPNQQPTPDQIATQVAAALQASSLDPNQVSSLGAARTACGGGSSSCQNPSAGKPQICVYYNVQLPNTSPNGSGTPACGVSVQFQYPYQFVLPFTSLNMQKIMLNANVQMTGEY